MARIAYFNGRYVPEAEVVLPFRDHAVRNGDSAYDTTRTFSGRPFRLQEHIDRLFASLAYIGIDPGMSREDLVGITEEVVARNEPLRKHHGDWWVNQRFTRGLDAVGDEGWQAQPGPTVIVDCLPLPLKSRAPLFRSGIDLQTSPVRRTPPWALSPNAKLGNKLNHVVADRAIARAHPAVWSLMLDENGHLAEGLGSNVFVVYRGKLLTPRERFVLPGISRRTVIELARELGIPFEESDIGSYVASVADEMFMTGSSFCMCPVRSLDGRVVGNGTLPGPITARLTKAYRELAGMDFVAQILAAGD